MPKGNWDAGIPNEIDGKERIGGYAVKEMADGRKSYKPLLWSSRAAPPITDIPGVPASIDAREVVHLFDNGAMVLAGVLRSDPSAYRYIVIVP